MARTTTEEKQPLQHDFEAILAQYAAARDHEVFGKENAVWSVFESLAAGLRETDPLSKTQNLKLKWSAGQGRWATVPWMAVLDKRETDKISQGVYVIYLFRADMAGVYLTLNQGASWALTAGNKREAFVQLRERAAELRTAVGAIAGFDMTGGITLGSPAPLIKAYEASTIATKYYARGSVPNDEVLRQDLKTAIVAYQKVVPTSRTRSRTRASLL